MSDGVREGWREIKKRDENENGYKRVIVRRDCEMRNGNERERIKRT